VRPRELRGALVELRPLEAADGDALETMFAEPAVARWWNGYDRARIEEELLADDGDSVRFAIVVSGDVAGVIQYSEEPDPDYRRAAIDIAVATRWHGRGVAVDAIRTVARYLIDQLGHHHLTIDPAADNGRAIAAYAKVGFKPVGILRENERSPDGSFHDTMLMDLLAAELT